MKAKVTYEDLVAEAALAYENAPDEEHKNAEAEWLNYLLTATDEEVRFYVWRANATEMEIHLSNLDLSVCV